MNQLFLNPFLFSPFSPLPPPPINILLSNPHNYYFVRNTTLYLKAFKFYLSTFHFFLRTVIHIIIQISNDSTLKNCCISWSINDIYKSPFFSPKICHFLSLSHSLHWKKKNSKNTQPWYWKNKKCRKRMNICSNFLCLLSSWLVFTKTLNQHHNGITIHQSKSTSKRKKNTFSISTFNTT